MNRWFTLYFIPLIPLGKVGQYVECRRCSNSYADTVLTQSPPNGDIVEAHPVFGAPGAVAANPFMPSEPVKMTTSSLARLSLLLGILVPFTVCVQPLWMGCALGSIICAIIAFRKIDSEPQKLRGKGLAIAGLILSFCFGGLFLFFTILLSYAPPPVNDPNANPRQSATQVPPNGSQRKLDEAERKISSNSQGNVHGNTPEAKVLAAKFSARIKELRDESFTKSKSAISASDGEFITYCELQPNRCVFVVHVPSYRKFAANAKATLAQIAWHVAQETTIDTLAPGDSLGIGLKGIALYGSVMVGNVGDNAPIKQDTKTDLLLPFFANPQPKPVTRLDPDSSPAESPEAK